MKMLKRLFCDHKGLVIYDGISGGMGFLFRKMHCKNCMKKFESLTLSTPKDDGYLVGQILTKEDAELFNNEVG